MCAIASYTKSSHEIRVFPRTPGRPRVLKSTAVFKPIPHRSLKGTPRVRLNVAEDDAPAERAQKRRSGPLLFRRHAADNSEDHLNCETLARAGHSPRFQSYPRPWLSRMLFPPTAPHLLAY